MDPAKPLRSDLALKFDAARLPLPPLSLQVPKRGNQTERAPRMHVCTNRENSAPRERAKKNNSAWALFCKMPTHLHFPQSRPARGGSRRRESLEAKSHLRVPAELPLVQSRYSRKMALVKICLDVSMQVEFIQRERQAIFLFHTCGPSGCLVSIKPKRADLPTAPGYE